MSVGKLPEGWVNASIFESISHGGLISDGDWVESKDQDPNGSVRLVQLADIGDGVFRNKSQRFMSPEKAQKLNCTYLTEGDVLIARMPDPLGRACIFPGVGQNAVTVVDVCLMRTSSISAISNVLLMHWINSPTLRTIIAQNASGSTRKRITRKKIEQLEIPIPPLAEQKIIAEKLNTLLAQVDSTEARLEQIPKILKRFRQAVLAAAVSEKNHQSESSIKKLSDISKFQNGYAFKSGWFAKEGPYQVIKLANIRDGYLFLENAPSYVNDEIGREFSKFAPEKGDILISMTGTRFKRDYGFSCLITKKQKLLINQRVGKIIPLQDKISSGYLSLFVRSTLFREQFFKGETGGVNQGNVGSQHIASITLSLPSMQEQHEIVRRVEQLFAYADTIEKQVNTALARVNHLTQSILAKAFRGELTAQWRAENADLISGENSATALLEKIKAERAASTGKKASRKKA